MTEEQDVINIADLFMKNSAGEGEKEDFWTGAAQDMLVAIMGSKSISSVAVSSSTSSIAHSLSLVESVLQIEPNVSCGVP
mgnify:CR=1 FL=1